MIAENLELPELPGSLWRLRASGVCWSGSGRRCRCLRCCRVNWYWLLAAAAVSVVGVAAARIGAWLLGSARAGLVLIGCAA